MVNDGAYPADQRCEHELLQQWRENLAVHVVILADMKGVKEQPCDEKKCLFRLHSCS